jgi:Fe-S-cluster-containing dehydrogenase component
MTRYGFVVDLTTCVGCNACVAACSTENQTPYWDGLFRTHVEDFEHGEFPNSGRGILPRLCMHCEEAPCVRVCPTGASYKTAEGVVLIDPDKCMGCAYCVAACPCGARYRYEEENIEKAKEHYGEDCRHQHPTIDKCTYCDQRVKKGEKPACVAVCPAHSRIFGDLDDPKSEVAQLVNSGKAQPLRESGPKPRTYYIR